MTLIGSDRCRADKESEPGCRPWSKQTYHEHLVFVLFFFLRSCARTFGHPCQRRITALHVETPITGVAEEHVVLEETDRTLAGLSEINDV